MAGLSRPLQLRRLGGAGPITLHLPRVIPVRFGLDSSPFARCYSGNPIWFLFLPLLRCFRSGGSRSLRGAPQAPEGAYSGKSHSGIPGSKAAYAYPGPFRGWPRPSSALKPSHSPDGVACQALAVSV